ncbi:Lipoate synthase [Actinomycetales bacterium JB111]|nr:Lipoate synthase [Actinomycetales bacterium JB111]
MDLRRVSLGESRIDYQDGWDLQRSVHAEVVAGTARDTLLVLEHEPVYTAGKRTARSDRPIDGSAVIDVDRGGRITWHGPGQIVVYPIVRLGEPVDVVAYVRALEDAVIDTCARLGLATTRVPGRTGVWVPGDENGPDRKICAIGVRVAKSVSMHGIALNVDPDLTAYDRIVPCGISDAGVTSLVKELGRELTLTEVADVLEAALSRHLAPLTPSVRPIMDVTGLPDAKVDRTSILADTSARPATPSAVVAPPADASIAAPAAGTPYIGLDLGLTAAGAPSGGGCGCGSGGGGCGCGGHADDTPAGHVGASAIRLGDDAAEKAPASTEAAPAAQGANPATSDGEASSAPRSAVGEKLAPNGRKLLRLEKRNAETPIESKPKWIKTRATMGPEYNELKDLVHSKGLHTVCEEAGCPNIFECWEDREATFLIGGSQCTRRCDFCQIDTGKPDAFDRAEPLKVASSVRRMGLKYATITGVARDDLDDGGAWLYAETVRQIKKMNPGTGVELLIPDFDAKPDQLAEVFSSRPEVLAHNVETVPRIFRRIRPGFRYDRSLSVIKSASEDGFVTKSNFMLGMGETFEEVVEALGMVREAGCDLITINQYMRPSLRHHPVERWVKPQEFVDLSTIAEELGYLGVMAGPLVRSSYRAGRLWGQAMLRRGEQVPENLMHLTEERSSRQEASSLLSRL